SRRRFDVAKRLRMGLAVWRTAALVLLVGGDRHARADIAEQLFENAELTSACRGRVSVVGDDASAFDAVIFDRRDSAAVETNDHHAPVGDMGCVERHLRLYIADIVPGGLIENRRRRWGPEALADGVSRIDANLRRLRRLRGRVDRIAVIALHRRAG